MTNEPTPHVPELNVRPGSPHQMARRRLLTGTAGGAAILSVVSTPVLGASCVPASRHASMHASSAARDANYTCTNVVSLSTMRNEPVAALKLAVAARVADLPEGQDRTSYEAAWAAAIAKLEQGDSNAMAALMAADSKEPALLPTLLDYEVGSWAGVRPGSLYSIAVGPLRGAAERSLIEVAWNIVEAPYQELAKLLLAGRLNTSSGIASIPMQVLDASKIRSIASEFEAKTYFEPTAGIRWYQPDTVFWLKSLGLTL